MSKRERESDVTRMLRLADPLIDDPGISDEQRMAMRRATLTQVPQSVLPRWRQLAPIVTTAALLALALGVARWPTSSERSSKPPAIQEGVTTAHSQERRILFETPGGTRVIWILNPDFPSRELGRSEKT